MKKIFTIGVAGCVAISIAVAAVPDMKSLPEGDYTILDPETHQTLSFTRTPEKTPQPEVSAGTAKVVVNAVFDKTKYQQHSLNYAFRHDPAKGIAYRVYGDYDFKKNNVTFTGLAHGLYDFMIEFKNQKDETCFVAVENVTIDKDTTFSVNPEVCTSTVTTRPIAPDGNEMEWYTYDLVRRDTISLGNMPYGYGYGIVAHTMAADPAYTHTIELYHKILEDKTETDAWHDEITWHFNESSRFKPMYMIQGSNPDYGLVLAVAVGDSVNSQVLTNNVADYMPTLEYTVPDYRLNAYDSQGLTTRVNNVQFHYLHHNVKGAGIGMITGNPKQYYNATRVTMCLPKNPPEWVEKFVQFCPEPGKIFLYAAENGNYGVFLPTVQQPDRYREIVMSPREPSGFSCRSLLLAPYGSSASNGATDWRVNPTFSFLAEDYPEIEFGVSPTVNYMGFSDTKCDILPIGLYGETQNIDLIKNGDVMLSFNDTPVSDYVPAFATAFKQMCEKDNKRGEWNLYAVTNNAKADNIQGSTTMEAVWDTQKGAYPPSMRILQFRNKAGKITNRGADGNDLKMMFAANTYLYQTAKYMSMTKAKNIKVEYAPFGSEDFTELRYEECPELYFTPSIGNVYKVDLTQISRQSPTFWYSLRFTLDNGDGAYQTQTVAPAFRLDKVSGISEISADPTVYVSGNDIIAPEGARIYSIAGHETGRTSLSPGLYLVRLPEKTVKVSVR